MLEDMEINGFVIHPGESAEVSLNVARLPTHTPIDLPVRVLRAEKDGPVILLTGGLHGDEINGIEIVRRMLVEDMIWPDMGTVIALPLVNVYGFIQNVRGLPDGKDINRSFPGSKFGSLAKMVAYTLMNQIIPLIDVGIDFHTGGASRANYPQIRCTFDEPYNLELARAFAAPVILHSSLIDKSFRKAASRAGKNILVYETGEAQRLDDSGVTYGIEGTLRVMNMLGMKKSAPKGYSSDVYRKSSWVRARYAGLFHPIVKLGEKFKKKQLLGRITDPFGYESFKVVASWDGQVIGLNNSPVVHKGDALMHIAISTESSED